eukprot:COSAG06_NODE_29925_length_548_cov_0.788419_1_plen_130_part_10
MPGAAPPPPLEHLHPEPGEEAVDSSEPAPAAPNAHTAALRHDGVLTLLDASADAVAAEDPKTKAKREKAEAKRVQQREKWRARAEKDAREAAAKHGTPDQWERYMLEVPVNLLSEEELAKRKWLSSVPLF